MNKQVEQIRAEIERLKKENESIRCNANEEYCRGYDDAFADLLTLVDSLPEAKPSKDLEEAAEECTQRMLESWRLDSTGWRSPRESFIKGAQWQKEQMLEDAVDGMIYQPVEHYFAEVIAQYTGELKHGDKVKLIIVKKDEQL